MKDECLAIENIALEMRKEMINMGFRNGDLGAHFGAGLSAVEIFACLYNGVMKVDPKNPKWEDRDILVVGKGHCVLAYYTALAFAGFFPVEDLMTFDQNGSKLMGHPIRNLELGIEVSSGSLGMALSQGVGIALAIKKKRQNRKVFVILGDGECQEGAIWEGAMSAAHYNLDNLIVIIDKNTLQYDGDTEEIMSLGNLKDKFQAFGFATQVINGHNIDDLKEGFDKIETLEIGKPKAIIAHTIKGKCISFMENNKEWHNKALTQELYQQAIAELGEV